MRPITTDTFSVENQIAGQRGIIRELKWKLSRLPQQHPAYVEAAGPLLRERLAWAEQQLARLEHSREGRHS